MQYPIIRQKTIIKIRTNISQDKFPPDEPPPDPEPPPGLPDPEPPPDPDPPPGLPGFL